MEGFSQIPIVVRARDQWIPNCSEIQLLLFKKKSVNCNKMLKTMEELILIKLVHRLLNPQRIRDL